ncbi:MAG: ImmA/IrrE family metallo-endopeptidase, partial [Streptosporangiales bacterium]
MRGELEARVRAAGYTVEYADPGGGRLGTTQPASHQVTIAPAGNPRVVVTTLAHELAHIQLGHTEAGYDYRAHRGPAEVQAESVAFV